MGMESWYLNIKIKSKIDSNDLPVISYELKEDGYILSISYSYLSFFESIKYVYTWIMNHLDLIIECETNNKNIDFSNGFLPFFNQIYELNEKKINLFYYQLGTIMIAPEEDTYKFLKKYKKKIIKWNNQGSHQDV